MASRPSLDRAPVPAGDEAFSLSRRTLLQGMACGAATSIIACSDDTNVPLEVDASATGAPDAGVDAGADASDDAFARPDDVATAGPDAGVDASDAAGADDASAAVDDAAPDAGADVAPDGPRPPGILSVAPDDPDVVTRMITFQSDTLVSGYLATPSLTGSFAGLILVHDEHGLSDHIKDVARRFAKSGCVTLVPDLASRAGGTALLGPMTGAYLATASLSDLLRDLAAAVDALAALPVVGAGRYGTCGLGFGGDLALRFAAANPRLRAAVVYYAATPMPADIMKTTNAAILGQYGANDAVIDAGIPALERAMMDAGKTFEKHLYDGAGHGFNDDTASTYDEDATVAAWAFTIGWFDPHLQPLP